MAKVMEIKDLAERTVGMTVRPLPEEIRDAVIEYDRNVLIGDPDGELGESEKVPAVDIREIHCKDGTVSLQISDYRTKHQFAGILENETVMPEEVPEKKEEILKKMERMEEKLANPDFDDIIHETDNSLSGGLKIAHDMNGKAGTTGAQYCFLFRRIHSLLDEIQSDGRLAGVMETLKEYDAKHGKILEWEETAEGWVYDHPG